MTETNIILKVQTFTFTDPVITVELTMPGRHDALDIADKLNDIAKAKKEAAKVKKAEAKIAKATKKATKAPKAP